MMTPTAMLHSPPPKLKDRAGEASCYAFFPQTFVVPSEYRMFVEGFKRQGGTWIMKPIGRAQGQGIFLFNKLSQVRQAGCKWHARLVKIVYGIECHGGGRVGVFVGGGLGPWRRWCWWGSAEDSTLPPRASIAFRERSRRMTASGRECVRCALRIHNGSIAAPCSDSMSSGALPDASCLPDQRLAARPHLEAGR